jgi:hypothetical protein
MKHAISRRYDLGPPPPQAHGGMHEAIALSRDPATNSFEGASVATLRASAPLYAPFRRIACHRAAARFAAV